MSRVRIFKIGQLWVQYSFWFLALLNLGESWILDSFCPVKVLGQFGRKIIINEVKSWNGIKTVPDTKISRS